jgi:hypothetical protein
MGTIPDHRPPKDPIRVRLESDVALATGITPQYRMGGGKSNDSVGSW